MRRLCTISIVTLILAGCAGFGQQSAKPTDTRVCAQNFTSTGSFFTGKNFKTHQIIKGVNKDTGMKRAAQYISGNGFSITNTDKELGIISASQGVIAGGGKTVPLNITIEPVTGGINVMMSYALSGGLGTSTDGVKNHFCSIIDAISGKSG